MGGVVAPGREGSGAFVWPPRGQGDDGAGAPLGASPVAPTPSVGVRADFDDIPDGRSSWALGGAGRVGRWSAIERRLLGASGSLVRDGWLAEDESSACPRCAGAVGVGEIDPGGCAACRGRRLRWDAAVRLGGYRGVLRDAIMSCKYRGDRASGTAIGRMLGSRVVDRLEGLGLRDARAVVVPVPATLRRRLANGGVDHALVLARGVAGALGVGVSSLLRRRGGSRQAAAGSAAARARNVRDAFEARSGRRPPGAVVVVLVDDVRTTGATAAACFGVLGARYGRGVRGVSAEAPVFVLATAAVSESRRGSSGAFAGSEGGSRGREEGAR
jgi:predicted amidophosphoribosyltransferase